MCVGEAIRYLKDPRERVRDAPLLLQQRIQLRTGQGQGHQRVAKRLHGKGVAVGNSAIHFALGREWQVARISPGFMNAATALPVPALRVATSCASAMISPRADSPALLLSRVIVAVMLPITRAVGAADRAA